MANGEYPARHNRRRIYRGFGQIDRRYCKMDNQLIFKKKSVHIQVLFTHSSFFYHFRWTELRYWSMPIVSGADIVSD